MSVIGSELCPACGRVVWLARLLSGTVYCHVGNGDETCFGEAFVQPADAEAVRRIREQGGERFRLAAHP